MTAATVTALAADAEGPFTLTDSFVSHMKKVMNPDKFGLRKDGRFYPYSSRYGRRIGYSTGVRDERWYSAGLSRSDAEKRLRGDLIRTAWRVRAHLRKKYPRHSFNKLSQDQQEMLVDHAYTEGVDGVASAFYDAVLRNDFEKIRKTYIRMKKGTGWPDIQQNRAFVERWFPDWGKSSRR